MTPLRIAGAVVVAGLSTAAPANGQNPELVSLAQRVPVSSLDSTLPPIPFDRWLAEVTGLAPSAIDWEVNDCGEGGDGLAAPTCVEAVLALGPGTSAHASLIIADLEGIPGDPGLWMLYAMTGSSITTFKSLAEWRTYVRQHGR